MPAEVINATEKNKLAVHYYVRALALGIPAIFLGLQIAGWIGFVRIIADGHGECWCGRHLQRTDAFLLGITASGLVSCHLLIHDLTIMIVPLFLVLDHCLFSEGKGQNLFRTSALVLAAPFSWRSPQHTLSCCDSGFHFCCADALRQVRSKRAGQLVAAEEFTALFRIVKT